MDLKRKTSNEWKVGDLGCTDNTRGPSYIVKNITSDLMYLYWIDDKDVISYEHDIQNNDHCFGNVKLLSILWGTNAN